MVTGDSLLAMTEQNFLNTRNLLKAELAERMVRELIIQDHPTVSMQLGILEGLGSLLHELQERVEQDMQMPAAEAATGV